MTHPFLEAIRGRATLAPMAGVTDRVFRSLCGEYGCPFAVTEMVSAKGFLQSPSRSYALGLLEAAPGEPLAAQLFGHEPDVVGEAAARLSQGPYAAIDINMGCPAPKITGNGEGSALMRSPHLARRVVREAVRASRVPVTVKMRLGWDAPVHVDFALYMQDAGAAALTVHGRTRAQMYAGRADWEAIGEVVRAVDIPVIANGDIVGYDSLARALAHTGCHAAAIGRGALGNPFVFAEIEARRKGEAYPGVTPRERAETAIRHAGMLCACKGERPAIPEMRKHAAWYVSGVRGGAALRRRINAAETLREMTEILRETVNS